MILWTIQLAKWRIAERMGVPLVDTTVKSGKHYFAPNWDMVMGHKNGTLSDEDYAKKYHDLMLHSYNINRIDWNEFLTKPEVAIACYCTPGKFCHRHLLADIFRRLHGKLGLEFQYRGEIVELPVHAPQVVA